MKILVLHTAFIGDVVLSTPLLKKIKEVYPNSKITYVTTPVAASILRNNPNINEIIEYDKKGIHAGIKGAFELGKRLNYEKFDIVITPHRYLRSTFLSWLTGAKEKIGYDISAFSFLFTKKIKYDKTKHEVEKLLSFIDGNNENKNQQDLREKYPIEIFPNEENIKKIEELWLENKFNSEKIITIAPGSKWNTKKWPEKYFNELIYMLHSYGYKIVVVGGKEEIEINIDVKNISLDLRGKTTLLELAEVFKKSKIVLTNDSSPIHIASAFENTHIIAIFGPTVRELGFFPWSKNSEVIEDTNLMCRPCGKHGGKECPKQHFKCMLDIKPEKVYKKIIKALQEENGENRN